MIPTWMMDSIQSQMIGGETAKYPVPWQVHVKTEYLKRVFPGIDKRWVYTLCGGTILNKNTVLTAAAVVHVFKRMLNIGGHGVFVSTGVTDIADDVKFQIQALIKVIH